MYYKIHLQANMITKLQGLNYSKKEEKSCNCLSFYLNTYIDKPTLTCSNP